MLYFLHIKFIIDSGFFCSFTWSYEKIHLSMVQVIKGHLVKCYDEEFRTLFARSSVPAELCPPEGLFQRSGPNGQQILPNSAPKIERSDQLRHTLDTVYRKTCERRLGTRDPEERLFEEDPHKLGPWMENGIGVHNQMSPQFQSTEAMNYLKRHSYAGERQDGCLPQNIRPRASNWNISKDTGIAPNNYFQMGQNRGQNIHQTYNCNDKQVQSMQPNMPTLENTSKSFMRSLRIESYLNNPDVPIGDSCDYLDQFDPLDKVGSFMQGRMRSSLVLRSTIPEQMEPNRHGLNSSGAPNAPLHYSSMQWSPTAAAENRMSNEEFMLKRQSLQILDDGQNNTGYGPARNSYQAMYTSLGRPKGGHMMTNPDILTDSWQKRHSVADSRSNTEYAHDSPGHLYGAYGRMQVNRSTAGINALNGGFGTNLNEDQRSISHYDVKSITGPKSPSSPIWQEPPTRTVSAAALAENDKDPTAKSSHMGSQHFLKKSTKKIKSLLNIPEKKEDSVSAMEALSMKSSTSTDTLTAEDEERTSDRRGNLCQRTTITARSSSERQRSRIDDHYFQSSKPRFGMEEHQNQSQRKTVKPSILDPSHRPGIEAASRSTDRGGDKRIYSRYESLYSTEKKQSIHPAHSFGSTRSQEKNTGLPKGEASIEHNLTRTARGHHENKLEKFFHRMGNLITKTK